ncbi:SID1 transmembrane family member 2 [Elysia marginata]|uniref:SID1 transmembrane family member 2 n=1 Tax=Elysia marginata TaxID=1093978 RepID=A0AAV4FTJ9_9GAST|nr:SID1 transmembrane family member 2 [Elysia marginata]
MLKIYQCRHPDINAKAHIAFFSMALIIFIAVIGVIYGSSVFWILYALFHMLVSLVLTAQIYYMGRWSIDRYIFNRLFLFIVSDFRRCSGPTYPNRFCLLLVGNIVNWGFAIYGANTQPSNFASFFLGIFIGNLLLYTLFYLIMKLLSRERLSWLVVVVILTSMMTWVASLYFFFDQLSNWQVSDV